MANLSDLTTAVYIHDLAAAATPADSDLFVLDDGSEAKKITYANLISKVETDMTTIKDAAVSAANSASGYATTASTAATNAATSAANALTSSQNAANSATAAGTSETNAANSATAAGTSETNAGNSATAAANSAIAAAASASTARSAVADILPTVESMDAEIVTFSDGSDDFNVKSYTLTLEPHQDLNGYTKPWTGGAGKNLLPNKTYQWTANNLIIGGDANDYTMHLTAGTYTLTKSSTKNVGAYYRKSDGNDNIIIISTSSGVVSGTFTIAADGDYKFWVYSSTGATASDIGYFMLEAGSTATTYEPYENICPISGYTAVEVSQVGKNLCEAYAYSPTNNVTYPMQLKAGTYTASVSDISVIYATYARKNDGNKPTNGTTIAQKVNAGALTFTLTEDTEVIVQWYIPGNTSIVYPSQVEVGSTATAYEAYIAPTTYDITLPSAAGTVYGGTLTVNEDGSGVLTVDSAMGVYDGSDDENWLADGSNRYSLRVAEMYSVGYTRIEVVSNEGTFYASGSAVGAVFGSNKNIYYYPPAEVTSVAEFRTWLSSNPLQVVYPLATPTTYNLSSVEVLQTLKGNNTFWMDADGTLKLVYRADIQKYIDKLTNSDADMVADANIPSGDYFVVNNRLFIATAAIAQGADIIPGTNCTETNLAAALNAI